MAPHAPPPLETMDLVGPVFAAVGFVVLMSMVREPARRNFNAIFVAGASAAYLGGGLGVWELPYIAVAGCVVSYLGLRSHVFIGIAWLMHTCWDVVHHCYANPLWSFMPSSSAGCAVFDAVIAIWFLAGAPSVFALGGAEARER